MAEQIKLKFPKKRKKTIKFGNQSVKINPIISAGVKVGLLKKLDGYYHKRLKDNDELFVLVTGLNAELDMLILTHCVDNVDFDDVDYEELLNSGFIDLVKANVINYHDVRQTAENMIGLRYVERRIPEMQDFKSVLGLDLDFSKFDNIKDEEKKAKIAEVIEKMRDSVEEQDKMSILSNNE